MSERSERSSTSLERGLAILSSFNVPDALLGITDLSQRLAMTPSTVHRYVATLVRLGYLERDVATRKYRIGFRAADLALAAVSGRGLADAARPLLETLSSETGKTVSLAVLDGTEVVYLVRVANPRGITLDLRIGSRLPAHCTAMGKVLLASLPPSELERRLDTFDLVPLTSRTITDVTQLGAELDAVRTNGYATNNQELSYDLRTVAAPVYDRHGDVVAAVNLSVGASSHSQADVLRTLLPKVVAVAGRISAAMGYRARLEQRVMATPPGAAASAGPARTARTR